MGGSWSGSGIEADFSQKKQPAASLVANEFMSATWYTLSILLYIFALSDKEWIHSDTSCPSYSRRERHWATNTVFSRRKVTVAGPETIKSKIPLLSPSFREQKKLKGILILKLISRKLKLYLSLLNVIIKGLSHVLSRLQIHLVASQTHVVWQVSEKINGRMMP